MSPLSLLLVFVASVSLVSQALAGAVAPSLGNAANFAILAATTVTSSGALGTVITGNIGLYPGTSITGFPPGVVVGNFSAAQPLGLLAQMDLTTAYHNLAIQSCNVQGHVLTGMNLGSRTLLPGVYCFTSAAAMSGILTLNAQKIASSVWVFQVASSIVFNGLSSIHLINGALAKNVFFQVGSSATLGLGAAIQGNILAYSSITLDTGATLNGRALANHGAVTMIKNVITIPV